MENSSSARTAVQRWGKNSMSDLIERQAAINAAIEAVDTWDGGSNKERERYICEALEKLPLVHSERESDEWIEALVAGMPAIHHKKCGAFVYAPNGKKGFNFCPNCGADMRG